MACDKNSVERTVIAATGDQENTSELFMLRILGLDTPVLLRGQDDNYLDDKMGYCDFKRNRIVLSELNPPSLLRETAMHEVLHAVDHATQTDLTEEDVHRLGRALYAVIRDNPDFVKWLLYERS